MPIGRPSKLTLEVRTKLLQALVAGNQYRPACAFAGIHYHTFLNWMKQGEAATKGEFVDFLDSVQRAVAQGEIASVAKIKRAEDEDWRAAAWMLERRHPERWANTQKVQVEVRKELSQALDKLEESLPPELYDRVLAVLADDDGSETKAIGATETKD